MLYFCVDSDDGTCLSVFQTTPGTCAIEVKSPDGSVQRFECRDGTADRLALGIMKAAFSEPGK